MVGSFDRLGSEPASAPMTDGRWPVPWFWTDDLARAAIEAGVASEAAVRAWIDQPAAVAVRPGDEPLAVATDLLGIDRAAGAA